MNILIYGLASIGAIAVSWLIVVLGVALFEFFSFGSHLPAHPDRWIKLSRAMIQSQTYTPDEAARHIEIIASSPEVSPEQKQKIIALYEGQIVHPLPIEHPKPA
jgi:hypothetical protein